MHLAIDGYGAEREKLVDTSFIYRFLDSFPDSIGMTKVTTPTVFTYHDPKFEDWGVTGLVIIAESHISVHTFPERSFVNIDVFSCRGFDAEMAAQKIKDIFSLTSAKVWTIKRGLEYYSPPPAQPDFVLEHARPSAIPLVGDG